MDSAIDAVTYQVPIRAAILSTLMVVAVDVLVLALVHHSLHKIGAFLALRELLNNKKAVKISELWFEEFTGRTHGPLWFRYTQAGVKIVIFAASIVLSLSFNGNTQDRLENIAGQTILIQKPRTLQNLELGLRSIPNRDNFSQELRFSLRLQDCYEIKVDRATYFSIRSTSPLKNMWTSVNPEIECLTKHRGFVHPSIQTRDLAHFNNATKLFSSCNISASSPSEVEKDEVFNFTVTGCPSTVLSFDCFTGRFETVCGALFTVGRRQWLYVRVGNSSKPSLAVLPRYQHDRVPIRTGKDTLTVVLRIAEHAPYLTGMSALNLALYQAAPNSTVIVRKGSQLVTEINGLLLWPSLAILGVVLVSCCFLSLSSKAVMIYTKWNVLDVGFSPEQVARLATMEHEKSRNRKSWHLHLHRGSPCITVSTDSVEIGDWAEENVENKYRKKN